MTPDAVSAGTFFLCLCQSGLKDCKVSLDQGRFGDASSADIIRTIWCGDCVRGLNALYSGEKLEAAAIKFGEVSATQRAALEHIFNSVQELGPPPVGTRRPRSASAASGFLTATGKTRSRPPSSRMTRPCSVCPQVMTSRFHWLRCWVRTGERLLTTCCRRSASESG